MSNRELIQSFYSHLANNKAIEAKSLISPDVTWQAAHPINDCASFDDILNRYWSPIKNALPDVERKVLVDVEGEDGGSEWVVATGYFMGTFENDLFGIPATHSTLHLRFTEIVGVKDGQIHTSQIILDFLDAMNQANVNPLRPSLGNDSLMMPPSRNFTTASDNDGDVTLQLIQDMLAELGRFDGKSLESMKLADFWHEDFMWYGPAGIGTTRGIKGFRAQHQGPFLRGFPDRSVDEATCYIGEGFFAATGGWPHMSATHTGPHWLGLAATGKEISLRVMDIWRRDGDKLKENWVGIDIIHILLQLGLDVFELMQERVSRGIKR